MNAASSTARGKTRTKQTSGRLHESGPQNRDGALRSNGRLGSVLRRRRSTIVGRNSKDRLTDLFLRCPDKRGAWKRDLDGSKVMPKPHEATEHRDTPLKESRARPKLCPGRVLKHAATDHAAVGLGSFFFFFSSTRCFIVR